MALTVPDNNNKLIQFTKELNKEYVRANLFSPYMSEDYTAIIRRRFDLKSGGEQMNIPLVTKLRGRGVGVGTLVGQEEKIDNYGMRIWLDWARNAVVTDKSQQQKDSADIFGEVKPMLSNWGKERIRDDIIAALMSLPSEAPPVGLGSSSGQTVNGILYEAATAGQRDAWNAQNADRVLYGAAKSNYNAVHATALLTVDTTADKLDYKAGRLMKRIARQAVPAITPYQIDDGREYFVCFCGTNSFRDLKTSLDTINKDARPREGNGVSKNPLFQDGDQIDDGVIYREIPEISLFVTNVWTSLLTAGATTSRVEPVFMCGQQAAVLGFGQMAKPTFRKEDDYGFIQGVGTEMAYGASKVFKKHPMGGTNLVQWGMLTGFFSAAAD